MERSLVRLRDSSNARKSPNDAVLGTNSAKVCSGSSPEELFGPIFLEPKRPFVAF